jgi:hypothetical protein
MTDKVYLGVCYFETYEKARAIAKGLGLVLKGGRNWPRANAFERGWAIQVRKSGPYVVHASKGPVLP